MIPFTQYLRPNGRRTQVEIDRPDDVEALARRFLDAGGQYECEELQTGHVSFTACHPSVTDGDIAIEVCMNGPRVPTAVDQLVRKSVDWLDHP